MGVITDSMKKIYAALAEKKKITDKLAPMFDAMSKLKVSRDKAQEAYQKYYKKAGYEQNTAGREERMDADTTLADLWTKFDVKSKSVTSLKEKIKAPYAAFEKADAAVKKLVDELEKYVAEKEKTDSIFKKKSVGKAKALIAQLRD
jgi:DNA repair ATPase RecN